MPKRVSQSLLDPLLTKPLKGLYRRLHIPARIPPEGIVLFGHVCAILGAIGFAFATTRWWGGLLGAAGVALNHIADVMDGTHARATGQCRNGGELLDHFVDPLSFSYWVTAMAYSADCLLLGIGGVVVIYSMAVIANIKAKLVGEFTLARFGPTEFKTLLILYGIGLAAQMAGLISSPDTAADNTFRFMLVMFVAGVVQSIISLWAAINEVNSSGPPPDQTEWEIEN